MLTLKDGTAALLIKAPKRHVNAAVVPEQEAFMPYPKLEEIVVSMDEIAVDTDSFVALAGGTKLTDPET